MDKKKHGFFGRMLRADKPALEVTMFFISIIVAGLMLVGIIWVGYYYIKGQTNRYTDKEVNAGTVTEAAVEIDEDEIEPVETIEPPEGNMIVNEDNVFDSSAELKDATEAYTTSDVNLRAEPSLTAEVLSKVPISTLVQIVEYDGKGDWAKVSYNNVEGYINVMYLSVDKPTPIVYYDPVTTSPQTTPKPTKKPRRTPTPEPEETEEPEQTEEPEYTEEPVITETPVETEVPPTEPTEAPPAEPTPAPPEPTPAPPEPTPAPPDPVPAEPTVPPVSE